MKAFSWVWTKVESMVSEPGTTSISWGRSWSTVHGLLAAVWVSFVIYKTRALPDFAGITTFVLAPYTVNKASTKISEAVANKA